MLTALGAFLIIGACTTLGLNARAKLRRRITVLSAMLDAISFLRAEIAGPHTPLPELIDRLAHGENPDQSRLFREMRKRMECMPGLSLGYHWSSTMRDFAEEFCFGQEETAILRDASSFLGRYDAGQQMECLQYAAARLESCRKQAYQTYRQHGNVYRTCGIAAGIFMVLILI